MLKHNLTKHYIDIQSVKFRHFCLDSFDILWLGLGALKYMSDLKMHMWLWRSNLQLPVSTLNLFKCSFSLICYLSQCRSLDLLYFHYCYFWHFFLYICEPPFLLSFNDLLYGIWNCRSLDLLFLLLAFNDLFYLPVLFPWFVILLFFFCYIFCSETKFEGCDPAWQIHTLQPSF